MTMRVVIVLDVEFRPLTTLDEALSMAEDSADALRVGMTMWSAVLNPPIVVRVDVDGATRLPAGHSSEG